MPADINERVSDSFDDNDHERITKYVDWILNSTTTMYQNVQRRFTLMLLLIAIFEAVAQSTGAKVSLAGFSITRNSIVFTFIPTLVAYLYFQVLFDTAKMDRLNDLLRAIFKKWSPKASENNLDAFLSPPSPLYWNEGIDVTATFEAKYDRLEKWASYTFLAVVFLGVFAFEMQAFAVLFDPNLGKDIFLFINVGISFSLLVYGFIAMISTESAGSSGASPADQNT